MKQYELIFSKSAEKDLKKLSRQLVTKILPVLLSLEDEPRPLGCRKLKGYQDLWRVRIGNYRAIYSINDIILLVDIRKVGHRKDIYKQQQ
jgi:mRNA interferase RelE/StbE